ncbi:hypothetical protein BKA66DRAFT_459441 [Pyrenochaeta sp. MPI-SDFR-AT-0127]|nr:hypothetical protein BKA66DRAFT_459441 [Pyrenochaeta sp. MPI-SDFR-AT-0127]
MPSSCILLSMLVLLVCTFAAPHDKDKSISIPLTSSRWSPPSKIIKTVVITMTETVEAVVQRPFVNYTSACATLRTPHFASTYPIPNYEFAQIQVHDLAPNESDNATAEIIVPSTSKTPALDPIAWAGMDGAINYTNTRRSEESIGGKWRKRVLNRFIALAEQR